jgi:HAD superfamily hydrolase (TIGR01549 family)
MTKQYSRLRGIIFDMDGTIVDVPYDWEKIREELKTRGKPILSYLASLPEPEKSRKWKILEKYEAQATSQAVMKEGMEDFFAFLRKQKVKIALVTNNSRRNVSALMKKFQLEFDVVLTRESGLWKPSGKPFLTALRRMGTSREECCVVGDSHFDVFAAQAAQIRQIFILADEREKFDFPGIVIIASVEGLRHQVEKLL